MAEWPPQHWLAPVEQQDTLLGVYGAPPVQPPPVMPPPVAPEVAGPSPEPWPPPQWLEPPPQPEPLPFAAPASSAYGDGLLPLGGAQPVQEQKKAQAPKAEPSPQVPPWSYPGEVQAIAQNQMASKAREGQLEAERAEKVGGMQADVAEKVKADMATIEADRQEQAKRSQAKLDLLMQEAQALNSEKIDPKQVWSDASVPQKIGAAVAVALGGFIAPNQGGRNPAMDVIERIIERDIDAQKANLANRRAGLSTKMSLYGQELENGRADHDARLKATLAGYDMAIKAIDGYKAQFESPIIQERASQAQAEIAARATDALHRYGVDERNFAEEQRQAREREGLARSQNAQGWARLAEDKRQFNAREAVARAEAKAGNPAFVVPGAVNPDGTSFVAATKEDATKLKQADERLRSARDAFRRLRNWRAKHGKEAWTGATSEGREAKAILSGLKMDMKNLYELGALSGPDMEILTEQLGDDPGAILDPTSQWNAIEQHLTNKTDNLFNSMGYDGKYSLQSIKDAPAGAGPPVPVRGSGMAPKGLPPAGQLPEARPEDLDPFLQSMARRRR